MENTIIPITHFQKLDLSPELMRGLTKMGFETPTPVQKASIRPMLQKRDLLVQAPTGTGKTAAFGIPVVEGIVSENRNIQTIILCPTRELAVQITTVLKQLASCKPGVRILAVYGGEPIRRQITALGRKPQIVVATPGRMLDHIRRRTARLGNVNCVVLDEADRMLDMGFRDDINLILQSVPTARQTVLFSATLSDGVRHIASEYQKDARSIHIQQETLAVEKVEQFYSEIRGNAKTPALLHLLREKRFGLSLVFVATKAMADTLARQLADAGFSADSLHGDLRQSQRDKVMEKYRSGKVNILVATDVAARGIDVNNIDAVVNYDVPGDVDSYVHRIGRTGRASKSGVAYTFIYPRERRKLQEIVSGAKASILPVVLNPVAAKGSALPTILENQTSSHRKGWEGKPRRIWHRSRQEARAGA